MICIFVYFSMFPDLKEIINFVTLKNLFLGNSISNFKITNLIKAKWNKVTWYLISENLTVRLLLNVKDKKGPNLDYLDS